MAETVRIGAALLAAGSSRRFGEGDKLAQPFRGRRLGEHAAIELAGAGIIAAGMTGKGISGSHKSGPWVITAEHRHPCEAAWRACGFDPILNPRANEGMGSSVALAAQLAIDAGLDALLLALADMPLVPGEHFAALARAVISRRGLAVSCNGAARLPPAMFGSDHFATLAALGGDTGARALLEQGTVIRCPPEWLIDIDTADALRQYGQAGARAPTIMRKGEDS